ncbi:MAG: prepilin-type N-terminal cleavage/methylation domain-containing protein [Desulfobulbus sp.]|nr:prepilin-type N-terminal cleavage/methylation domain-containing protein [Desulfobulbus sp.]
MPASETGEPCRAADHRGFTLVELLVVMVLMAVIASFAVPRIGDFIYADQLKTTVRRLVGLIHRSAQMARQSQAPYLLTYQPGERLFVARPEEQRTGKKDEAAAREERLSLTDTVTVQNTWSWFGGPRAGDAMVIRFNKNGYVEPTIIYLRQEDGQEMSVILTPFLGKVKAEEGYVSPETEALFQ